MLLLAERETRAVTRQPDHPLSSAVTGPDPSGELAVSLFRQGVVNKQTEEQNN